MIGTVVILLLISIGFLGGEVLRVTSGNLSVTLLDVAVGCVVVGWYARLAFLGEIQKKLQEPFFKYLFIFALSGLVGLTLQIRSLTLPELFTSVLYLIRLLVYYSLLPLISSLSKNNKRLLSIVMTAVGIGIVAVGFVQYYFYPNLRNLYYLGWDDHLYRLFSVFLDPNFAGAFFAILLIFYCFTLFSLLKQRKSYAVVFGILSVLTLLALFLTYSRTAFLMLLAGLVVYLAILKYYRILFVGLIVCVILFFSFANTKIEGLNPFRTASSEARVESASHAITIFSKHPLFGVGFNAYRYAQIQMGFRQEMTQYPSHADAGTDNAVLFLLATTGVVGLATFGLLWFTILKHMQFKQTNNKALVFATIGSLLFGSLFTNLLFYPFLLVWLFAVLGGYSE